MSPASAISAGRSFYAPRFEIVIDGQAFEPYATRDVLEVTYADSLTELEYFEFTLNDWDPVRNAPKYSSPYDETGSPVQDGAGGTITPIEPGMTAELSLGYYGPEDIVPKLSGTVVSITPSFPDTGMPQMKVRVLSELFTLQKEQLTREFIDMTDTAIAQSLAGDLGLEVATTPGQEAGETPVEFLQMNNEYPINFLMRRARLLGYDVAILSEVDPSLGLTVTGASDDGKVLFFGPSDPDQPVYDLAWGKTLASFNIAVRVKEQVSRVTVKSTNPALPAGQQEIEAEATLDDLDLDFPDPRLLDTMTEALTSAAEVVVDEPVQNQAEADAKALGILRERVKDMVTAEGSTVGFPDLRAGRVIEVTGVGARYSGRWVLTKTTHKLDSTGYTTKFNCRLEGSLP
ncbi:phage late control D family protein [Thalassococcus sp. BH17M4-6]|uniref:phage late control D family protein n=1 Tax=Thalassococcus sp. BH17M4-6 TaxID=3413148 RepID=UPI003BBC954C